MADSVELAQELQAVLSSYVKREIALDALQDALDDLAPKLAELPSDKYAPWAADHAEILIAELMRDHRSEDEMRKIIRDEILLPSVEVIDATAASTVTTSADSAASSDKVYSVAA